MRKVMLAAAGVALVAAAAVMAVIMASLALFHVLQASLGTAAAYGVVALVAAAVAAVLVLFGGLKPRKKPPPEPSFVDNLGRIARERPILSAGAALAASIVALKNPSLVGAVLTSFLAGRSQGKDSRRR